MLTCSNNTNIPIPTPKCMVLVFLMILIHNEKQRWNVKILTLIKFYKIDLVIVGPEEPLVKGLVDFLEKNKVKVFGPNKYASKLEGSKAFMKKLCKKNKIPTADFKVCNRKSDVLNFLDNCKMPIVVKADGLAAGKGVTICKTKKQVLKISNAIFNGKFSSSKKLVVEEFLDGEEASYFLIVDTKSFKFFGTAQDHKRAKENDKGPNTGGMGAYSPAPIINKLLEKKIIDKIVKPTLRALRKMKNPYKGFILQVYTSGFRFYVLNLGLRVSFRFCQVT